MRSMWVAVCIMAGAAGLLNTGQLYAAPITVEKALARLNQESDERCFFTKSRM